MLRQSCGRVVAELRSFQGYAIANKATKILVAKIANKMSKLIVASAYPSV